MRTPWLASIALASAACADPPQSAQIRAEACARLDEAWSVESVIPAPAACPSPPTPRDLSDRDKLAVAVLHFNVQYVAGGLRGFPDGTITPDFDFDEPETEDMIVRVGLEPVLDFFLAHPSFHADLELQGYMVEIIASRHPPVLAKMQALASRGQIDFDSFHYSDQLWIAYPDVDQERSLALTKAVFDRACLPIGRAIFTQEGQFAVGQLAVAARRGYRTSIIPKNLFRHQVGEGGGVLYVDPSAPQHPVIVGGRGWSLAAGEGAPFRLDWTFMDDGELVFSKDRLNPYFGKQWSIDPEEVAEYQARLEQLEAQGYTIATVAEAVEAMVKRGIRPAPLPPLFDGTWQPDDTANVGRWMGGSGLFRASEADSEVLASVWRARSWVEAAELNLPRPGPKVARGITAAWREALLAEVSDATGWNPFRNEVQYADARAAKAEALAKDSFTCGWRSLPAATPVPCEGGLVDLAALGVEVVAPARAVTTTARRCGPGMTRIEVAVPQVADEDPLLDDDARASAERDLELRFRRGAGPLVVLEALRGSPRAVDLDAYRFESTAIALPKGLIGIGGGRFVLQDHSTGRVAATLTRTGPDRGLVRFVDRTVPRARAGLRRYYLLEGVGEAAVLGLADAVNRPGAAWD